MVAVLAFLMAQPAADPGAVARGEKLFAQSCAIGYCHGIAGAASRGPRLRGRVFRRGYLVNVVGKGIPGTGMPGFAKSLAASGVDDVVAYVMSLASASGNVAAPAPAAAQQKTVETFAGPAEAKRGRDLFFDATRGTRCGTCHIAEGRGLAVGPELKGPAVFPPRPKMVRAVRLGDGDSFTGLVAHKDSEVVRLWDLSSQTPVLRMFSPAEIAGISDSGVWDHSMVTGRYTKQEIAAIQAYLRWLGSSRGER
jgi:mono/diheme cytochrome c family protein